MTEKLLQLSSQPIKEGVYSDLEAALWDTFGVKFQVWHSSARPTQLNVAASDELKDTACATSFAIDAELFARAAEHPYEPELLSVSDSHCWLVIPVTSKGKIGVIVTGLIRTSDPPLLMRLARQFQNRNELDEQVSQFNMERSSLIHQISADFEELAFLRQMAERLAMADSALDTMELAAKIFPELRKRIHAEAVVLISAGLDKAACLVGRPVLCDGRNVMDDRSCTRLVEKFRDAALLQPAVRNHCAQSSDLNDIQGLRNFVLTPLARSKSVLGWLLAINRVYSAADGPKQANWCLSHHEFGTNEASLLRSTASVLATHDTNVELLRDKDQLLFDMVRALVNSIEAKDRYTYGHSERVALYARQLGSAMALKTRACKRIYLSGLLHDVGKIAVRDAVLAKDGKLDAGEFAEIQEHPDKGWGILFGLEALDNVLVGVLHHHEQWDGHGYPDGLSGENIPLDARILAIADAFDAMTSDRPYRKAMSIDRARSILSDGAGSQWDPAALCVFLKILPQIAQIRDNYQPRRPATRRGYRHLLDVNPEQPGPTDVPLSAACTH